MEASFGLVPLYIVPPLYATPLAYPAQWANTHPEFGQKFKVTETALLSYVYLNKKVCLNWPPKYICDLITRAIARHGPATRYEREPESRKPHDDTGWRIA